MAAEQFRVQIGDVAFEVSSDDGGLSVDGGDMTVSVAPIGPDQYTLLADGRSHTLLIEGRQNGALTVRMDGVRRTLRIADRRALLLEAMGYADRETDRQDTVRAPMPGLVRLVHVKPGDTVQAGAALLVLEAMKMENELRAAHGGTIGAVHVAPDDAVGKGDPLIEFEV